MSRPDQFRFAAHAWYRALGLCIRSLSTLQNRRAALAIGRCRPSLPLLKSALVEIGLAAIDDILLEAEHEHRD